MHTAGGDSAGQCQANEKAAKDSGGDEEAQDPHADTPDRHAHTLTEEPSARGAGSAPKYGLWICCAASGKWNPASSDCCIDASSHFSAAGSSMCELTNFA
jgi:hypothetical protein